MNATITPARKPTQHLRVSVLAGACLLTLALLFNTVLRATAPRMAVVVCWIDEPFSLFYPDRHQPKKPLPLDPWGEQWRAVPERSRFGDYTIFSKVYSCGPNRVGEHGTNDDVVMSLDSLTIGAEILAYTPELLLIAGLLAGLQWSRIVPWWIAAAGAVATGWFCYAMLVSLWCGKESSGHHAISNRPEGA